MDRGALARTSIGARALSAVACFRQESKRLLLATVCLSLLCVGHSAFAETATVILEEAVSGVASLSTTVATSGDVTAAAEDLYLAAVSMKGFTDVASVDGLGLTWTLVEEQCSGRGTTGVSLWMAQGIATASGPVSAQFGGTPNNAVISVARYSGVKKFDPVGAIASANRNGAQGACTAGVDTATYSTDVDASSDGAVIFSAAAIRQRTHTPGAGYTEIDEIRTGATGGSTAAIATQQRTLTSAGTVPADGSFNNTVDWAVVAVEIPPGLAPRPGDPTGDIWISPEELALKPLSGEGWERLIEAANGDLLEPNISRYTEEHDANTLAVALVYARTGVEAYRAKAADAIMAVIGSEYTGCRRPSCEKIGALAVTIGRNLACYIISADLIDFAEYDPEREAIFRAWIDQLRYVEWEDGSIIAEDEQRTNNHGRVAGASRVVAAAYLGDRAELRRAAQVFKGFQGDHGAYNGFKFNHDLSWQADESNPIGINPVGATKDGHDIDGALPEEMRRGGSFQYPPGYTGYPWGALQAVTVEAEILRRQGYDAWNWEERAILRAVEFVDDLALTYPQDPWWAVGDDKFVPWLINHAYGTEYPTEDAWPGKIMGWTGWSHAPCETLDGECIPVPEPGGRFMLLGALPLLAWLARRRERRGA
jgi:hypothetical protein